MLIVLQKSFEFIVKVTHFESEECCKFIDNDVDDVNDSFCNGFVVISGRVKIRCFSEPSFPDGILKSADLPPFNGCDTFDSRSLDSQRYAFILLAIDELCCSFWADAFMWYCDSRCCTYKDGGEVFAIK